MIRLLLATITLMLLLILNLCGCALSGLPPWCDGSESYCLSAQEMGSAYQAGALNRAYRASFGAPSATCTTSCHHGRCSSTCF